jgi:hypothetical protein
MLGKIGISVAIVAALVLGAVRLPVAACILSNAPAEKACTMGCCANMACCMTSHKGTGLPVQPLAKSGVNQQNIGAIPATVAVTLVTPLAMAPSHVFSSADGIAHSPPPLALICIRLI